MQPRRVRFQGGNDSSQKTIHLSDAGSRMASQDGIEGVEIAGVEELKDVEPGRPLEQRRVERRSRLAMRQQGLHLQVATTHLRSRAGGRRRVVLTGRARRVRGAVRSRVLLLLLLLVQRVGADLVDLLDDLLGQVRHDERGPRHAAQLPEDPARRLQLAARPRGQHRHLAGPELPVRDAQGEGHGVRHKRHVRQRAAKVRDDRRDLDGGEGLPGVGQRQVVGSRRPDRNPAGQDGDAVIELTQETGLDTKSLGVFDESVEAREVFHDDAARVLGRRPVQVDDAGQQDDDLEEQAEAAVLLGDAGLHVPAQVPLVDDDGPAVEGGVELVHGPDAAEQPRQVGRVLGPRGRVLEVEADRLGVAHGLGRQLGGEVPVRGEVGAQREDDEEGDGLDAVPDEAEAEGLADGGREAPGEFGVGQGLLLLLLLPLLLLGRVLAERQVGLRARVGAGGQADGLFAEDLRHRGRRRRRRSLEQVDVHDGEDAVDVAQVDGLELVVVFLPGQHGEALVVVLGGAAVDGDGGCRELELRRGRLRREVVRVPVAGPAGVPDADGVGLGVAATRAGAAAAGEEDAFGVQVADEPVVVVLAGVLVVGLERRAGAPPRRPIPGGCASVFSPGFRGAIGTSGRRALLLQMRRFRGACRWFGGILVDGGGRGRSRVGEPPPLAPVNRMRRRRLPFAQRVLTSFL
ncbi:hypothetical protein CTA1_4064 [Colletotrichum tanaceti]|uniref:Uncharacterized protein n=1 Tax=Colletotrichum tanaceti TaxID=1306861 RepID=A0A4U6X2A5_9PEZI|nr:hypothetical protein CTA1_4064 [Colletotrichum tanaceti]